MLIFVKVTIFLKCVCVCVLQNKASLIFHFSLNFVQLVFLGGSLIQHGECVGSGESLIGSLYHSESFQPSIFFRCNSLVSGRVTLYSILFYLPSGKLTWQWKMDLLKMYSLLNMGIFQPAM